MNDIALLTLTQERLHYDRFSPLVKEWSLSKECWDLFQTMGLYFKSYPSATKVDWEQMATFFFMAKGKLKPEKASIYRAILENCQRKADELSKMKPEELPKFEKDVYKHYVRLDYLTRITNKALTTSQSLVSSGTADFDPIRTLLDEADKELARSEDDASIFTPTTVSTIVSHVTSEGLEWPLEELNVSLGPIRKGDFIVVGAYVETGKTTFAAHVVSHMARQMDEKAGPILWINNEEQSSKVMFRIIQSYFGITTEELLTNPIKYEELYAKEVGNRILIPTDDSGYNSTGRLNRLFRDYSPSLIVFDQLDKVYIHGEYARDDIRLGSLYKWARDVSKRHCPVIAITQVDATGASSEWLTLNQLRGSKVDKPAEADAIITIGRSMDASKAAARYIHFPKNKLLGGKRSVENQRHGYHEVAIKPEIARYVGTMKRVK